MFPDAILTTPDCSVELYAEGVSEEGGSEVAATWTGPVNFSEKSRTAMTADGKVVRLEGKVICKGDIAPDLKTLANGKVTVAGKTYIVFASARPRGPDGKVHHTTLELM